jgi:hypothetical protein
MRVVLLALCTLVVACDVPPTDDGRAAGDEGEGEGLRCACDGVCACEEGARGTGGLNDSCTSGNDCASAVCLEGPPPSTLCTEACVDDGDCGGDLPVCADIAFVGRVCIRTPPP